MTGRLFLSVAIGLVGAVLVHIGVIFAMPQLAERNAWGRFAGLGELYDIVTVDALQSDGPNTIAATPDAQREAFAFVDPAFITASCRFSLENGLVRMTADGGHTGFWSASIYDGQGDNLYSINDRSAVNGALNLLVGTHGQIVDAMADMGSRAEQTMIPVEVNLTRGYMTVRVFVGEESKRPAAQAFVSALSCEPTGPQLAGRSAGRDSRG